MSPNPEDKPMTETPKPSAQTKEQRAAEFSVTVDAAVEDCAEFNYVPQRFIQVIQDKGALATAKQFVVSGEIQTGLQRLAKEGRLELSIESVMCEFPDLFTVKEIEAAKWRIGQAEAGRLE